jgi:hypothetical protein
MTDALDPPPVALDRAAGTLSEAATLLTLAMLAAYDERLAAAASVLADAVEAELAAVVSVRIR